MLLLKEVPLTKHLEQQIFVSIGSNIDRYQHITAALNALHKVFGALLISSIYESEAVGFDGDNFLNLVVGFNSGLSITELDAQLKTIEDENGRKRTGPKFSARTLDIDILTVDDCCGIFEGIELPRAEILENAFVLLPLAEIAAGQVHPAVNKTYQALWDAYDKQRQKLWPVDFTWQDRLISRKQITKP